MGWLEQHPLVVRAVVSFTERLGPCRRALWSVSAPAECPRGGTGSEKAAPKGG